MIEAGASGVHLEDQLASEKKCGHLGGKVGFWAFTRLMYYLLNSFDGILHWHDRDLYCLTCLLEMSLASYLISGFPQWSATFLTWGISQSLQWQLSDSAVFVILSTVRWSCILLKYPSHMNLATFECLWVQYVELILKLTCIISLSHSKVIQAKGLVNLNNEVNFQANVYWWASPWSGLEVAAIHGHVKGFD